MVSTAMQHLPQIAIDQNSKIKTILLIFFINFDI